MQPLRSAIRPFAVFLLAFALAGCSKEDKIIVENNFPPDVNDPPVIVTYAPTFPPAGLERISYGNPEGITLQVLVGDPDGLDDISAVALDVDSVVLRRYILRPDTSLSSCLSFSFAPNDTVPTALILPVPASFEGLKFQPLKKIEGGLWILPGLGSSYGFPDFLSAASNLSSWDGGCWNPAGFLYPYYADPPALPSRQTVVMTYANVDYLGIRVNVYDKVGATAQLALPNLKLIYTTPEERTAAP